MSLTSLCGTILNGKYRLNEYLGYGAYGDVYGAIDRETNEMYALKVEKKSERSSSLKYEHTVYRKLHLFEELKGVPKIYHFQETQQFRALVMDRLGRDLDFRRDVKKPQTFQILQIGFQVIDNIQRIHSKGVLHLDLKPDNLMFGYRSDEVSSLYIVDFGMAELMTDWRTGKHRECKKEPHVCGSLTFSSINTHNQVTRSRKDDLESIGYSLIYFFRGSLPWDFITGSDHTIYYIDSKEAKPFVDKNKILFDQIGKMKKEISVETLCKGLPDAMAKYFTYVRNLTFSETPNYDFLKSLFVR